MTDPSATDQTKRAWDHSIQLSTGIKARITATGWIGGRFLVQYSDESTPRLAGAPGDYVYPSAIRIDNSQHFLFCLARGYRPIGNTPVTLLFVYDLQRRKLVHSYNLKNNLITNV